MQIAIGCDHRGLEIKKTIHAILDRFGHQLIDVGAFDTNSVDYPDVASDVCTKITAGVADRGILICCTGIGMCIAANKFQGIRAATCNDEITACKSREQMDVNVLCLSADLVSRSTIDQIIRAWLESDFEGGRHARRIEKISDLEASETRRS